MEKSWSASHGSAGARKGQPPRSAGFPPGRGPRHRLLIPGSRDNKSTKRHPHNNIHWPAPPNPSPCGKLDTNAQHQNAHIRNILHEICCAGQPSIAAPAPHQQASDPAQPAKQKLPNRPNLSEPQSNQYLTTQSRSRPPAGSPRSQGAAWRPASPGPANHESRPLPPGLPPTPNPAPAPNRQDRTTKQTQPRRTPSKSAF